MNIRWTFLHWDNELAVDWSWGSLIYFNPTNVIYLHQTQALLLDFMGIVCILPLAVEWVSAAVVVTFPTNAAGDTFDAEVFPEAVRKKEET